MTASVAALFRYPIKGFTPQAVARGELAMGAAFPGDRMFAVEDGPSGFDPDRPAWISKQRFTVLAKIARVAAARTECDPETGQTRAQADGAGELTARLDTSEGRDAFAGWLTGVLGEAASGPLRVLDGRGHRFLDHPAGHVSVLNLASVRDLEQRLGRPINPLRFRANIHVDGWPAWAENGWTGREMILGDARAKVFKPITRCAAPNVDPDTAESDIDMTGELHRLYGHVLCGIYVQVTEGGTITRGDEVELV